MLLQGIPKEDIVDALLYYLETIQENGEYEKFIGKILKMRNQRQIDLTRLNIKILSENIENPSDVVDISAFINQKRGWLLNHSRENWEDLMRDAVGREFRHIIKAYNSKSMVPIIKICGEFGDGRGRCLFYYSINESVQTVNLEFDLLAIKSF